MKNDMKSALQKLDQFLCAIGSANDAEDHGYLENAQQIRDESKQAIRDMINECSFLAELFPTLQVELESQNFLDFGWASFSRKANEEILKPRSQMIY